MFNALPNGLPDSCHPAMTAILQEYLNSYEFTMDNTRTKTTDADYKKEEDQEQNIYRLGKIVINMRPYLVLTHVVRNLKGYLEDSDLEYDSTTNTYTDL